MTKQLNMETGRQVIETINRLSQLAQLNSTDANSKAETAGLTELLRNQLFEHAGHLMGCWFAIETEYQPLCNTLASVLNRAQGIQAQRNPESAKANTTATVEETALEESRIAPAGTPIVLSPNFRKGPAKR